jgi:hypothetical protein
MKLSLSAVLQMDRVCHFARASVTKGAVVAPSNLVEFSEIRFYPYGPERPQSCQVLYDRYENSDPCTLPPQPHRARCTPDFHAARLGSWLTVVANWSPPEFGSLVSLTTGGLYNPDSAGSEHRQGKAVDVDILTWERISIEPRCRWHAAPDVAQRRRYIGIDALCRTSFDYVLDGWYNPAHHDHIHCDLEWAQSHPIVLDKGRESHAGFCQATCNDIFSYSLKIDGRWGADTEAAMAEAQSRTGVDGDLTQSAEAWGSWLREVARAGLRGELYLP